MEAALRRQLADVQEREARLSRHIVQSDNDNNISVTLPLTDDVAVEVSEAESAVVPPLSVGSETTAAATTASPTTTAPIANSIASYYTMHLLRFIRHAEPLTTTCKFYPHRRPVIKFLFVRKMIV